MEEITTRRFDAVNEDALRASAAPRAHQRRHARRRRHAPGARDVHHHRGRWREDPGRRRWSPPSSSSSPSTCSNSPSRPSSWDGSWRWCSAGRPRCSASTSWLSEDPSIKPMRRTCGPLDRLRGDVEFRDLTFFHPTEDSREPALREHRSANRGRDDPWRGRLRRLRQVDPREPDSRDLFEVEPGKVFIDGHEIHEIPLATLRREHRGGPPGFVPVLGHPRGEHRLRRARTRPRESIVRAAERAQLAKDIEDSTARGYETLVGERGVMLSGGQRQRTALARAH